MLELFGLGAQWGLAGVVVTYFMWRDNKRDQEAREREASMTERIEEGEKWARDVLVGLVTETKDALRTVAETIKNRPCFFHNTENTHAEFRLKD